MRSAAAYLRFRPTDFLLWGAAAGLIAQFVLTGDARQPRLRVLLGSPGKCAAGSTG